MREGGSIHDGHFHIREHNGVMPGADKAERLKAVVGGIRFGSKGEQDFGTDLLIDAFVVDEQRARRMLWLVNRAYSRKIRVAFSPSMPGI